MEEIQFEFKGKEDKEITDFERADAIMSFIANRALPFDNTKYDRIVFEVYDLPESQVAWQLALIIANYKNVKFYVRKVGNPRFWKKNKTVFAVSDKKFKKLWIDTNTLKWDALSTCDEEGFYDFNGVNPLPQIFYGLSSETIKDIAKKLYGWSDNRREFKKTHKTTRMKKVKR